MTFGAKEDLIAQPPLEILLNLKYGHGTYPGVSNLIWLVHYLLSNLFILTCTPAREYPYSATFFLTLGFLSVAWSSLKSFLVLLQTFVLPGKRVCLQTHILV
jgi:hypothetical protein